jgi:long-chain fatty acid transport protein
LKSKLLLLVASVLISTNIFAGGFQINEHSARAMAMGGAFTAVANDPSAIYFNGAGLTQLSGTQFLLGTTIIGPVSTFRGVSPEITQYDMKKQYFPPVHFWLSHSINEQWAVGIGLTSPFGLGTEWEPDWIGRYLAVKTDLNIFTITPTVAFKVNDELSLSAGFVYSWGTVKIEQKASQFPFEGDADVVLDGNDNSAFGYNFGLMYKPIPALSLGASFHSQVKYDFKGTATSTGLPQLAPILPNGDISAVLKSPYNLAFGVAYDVNPQLKLSVDFQYVGWSSYDTLGVDFANPNFDDIASPRLYDDSFIIRLGGEYKTSETLSLGAGIYYDKMPVKPEYMNPSLPEGDRLGLSLGVNYKFSDKFGLSASYLFIRANQVTVNDSKEDYTPGAPFNGTYNSYANLVSLSLSYGL